MSQNKFFEYNLPLQCYRGDDGKTVNVMNYMPRKSSVVDVLLSDLIPDGMTEKEFFCGCATNLLNLAMLMAEYAHGKRDAVYYHDEDSDKHFPPDMYVGIVTNYKFKLYEESPEERL